jgi:hypothetical protein
MPLAVQLSGRAGALGWRLLNNRCLIGATIAVTIA